MKYMTVAFWENVSILLLLLTVEFILFNSDIMIKEASGLKMLLFSVLFSDLKRNKCRTQILIKHLI